MEKLAVDIHHTIAELNLLASGFMWLSPFCSVLLHVDLQFIYYFMHKRFDCHRLSKTPALMAEGGRWP